MSGSPLPLSPLVQSTYSTRVPSRIHRAMVPPQPISASSGCGVTTIALSGLSIMRRVPPSSKWALYTVGASLVAPLSQGDFMPSFRVLYEFEK